MPKINAEGLALIKSFEGLDLHAYQDIVGVWTIGWGTTGKWIKPGMVITEAQAESYLQADLAAFEAGVSHATPINLTPNQFAALVSFTYNLGLGALQQGGIPELLARHDFQGVGAEMLHFDHAGGRVVAGLLRRREAERDLFLKTTA